MEQKGYSVDFLIDGNSAIYVISKEEGERTFLGCYTTHGWFHGSGFGAEEFWWNSISTQECEGDNHAVFEKNGKAIICLIIADTFIPAEKDESTIQDVVAAIVARAGGALH